MLDLNDHHYFVQAVDHGGFAAAARALDIPKSTISRRVMALEARLGVRLIERSSRRFVPTDVGQAFYRHTKAMLIEAEAAELVVQHRLAEPSGTIRLTCSIGMAPLLAETLAGFLSQYPKVRLIQYATNKNVDLVEEGFDLALRGHSSPLPDSALIQRRIASTPWQAFAAPAYLADKPPLQHPAELSKHATLALGAGSDQVTWTLSNDQQSHRVELQPRLRSSDMSTLKTAAIAGHGIVSLPAYIALQDVLTGTLEQVLPGWQTQQAQVTLLTPSRRHQLPSVRALIEFLAVEFPKLTNAEAPDVPRSSS